ncbi:MAG: hypothetical protein LBG97_09035 [Coriobacteriales bacterium]|jgi:hypothetical protein|nr:hypothetical protein [Coriobacteriales bacterium]
MDKIPLKLVLIISVIIAAISYTFFYDYNDAIRISALGNTKYTTEFYIKDTSVSTSQALSFFRKLSSECNVSIVKVTEAYDDAPETIYSGIFVNNLYPVNYIGLTDGRFIQDDNEFLASYNSNDSHQVGGLYEFMGNHKVSINSLSAYYDKKGIVNGTYRLISTESFNEQALLTKISDYFTIDVNALTQKTSFKVIQSSGIGEFGIAALVFIGLIFCLFIASVPIRRAKEIGVQSLLGWSSFSIWKGYLKGIPLVFCATIAIFDIGLLCFVSSYSLDFLFGLILVQIVALIVFICLTSLLLLLVNSKKTSSVLKDSMSLRPFFAIASITKLGYVVMLIVFTLIIAPSLTAYMTQIQTHQELLNQGDLYVINSFTQTKDDFDDMVNNNGRQGRENIISIYPLLNKNYGAIYSEGYDSIPAGSSTSGKDLPARLIVNPNYLQSYTIFDVNSNKIIVNEDETAPVVLIPASKITESEAALETLLGMYSPFGASDNTGSQKPKIYYYQDSNSIFTFYISSSQADASTGNYLQSPVIEVITEGNVSNNTLASLGITGISNPIKLPANTDMVALDNDLKKSAVANNDIRFDTVKNVMAEQISKLQGVITTLFAAYIALFFASMAASIFLVQILIMAKRRWLLVAKLHAIPFYKRYAIEATVLLSVNILALLFAYLFSNNLVALLLLLVSAAADVVVAAFVISRLEKRNFSNQLKGA